MTTSIDTIPFRIVCRQAVQAVCRGYKRAFHKEQAINRIRSKYPKVEQGIRQVEMVHPPFEGEGIRILREELTNELNRKSLADIKGLGKRSIRRYECFNVYDGQAYMVMWSKVEHMNPYELQLCLNDYREREGRLREKVSFLDEIFAMASASGVETLDEIITFTEDVA